LGLSARIAALEGRKDDVDTTVHRILSASPTGDQELPMRALRAFTLGDAREEQDVLRRLKEARALTIGTAFSDVAVYSGNLAGTERFAQEFLTVARSPELQALCHIILAHIAVMRGRQAEALTTLSTAQGLDRAWALEIRGLFAALPFFPFDSEQVAEVRNELTEWDAAATPPSPNLPLRVHNGLHAHLRLYLLGLLHARLGDFDRAGACASDLLSLEDPAGLGPFVRTLAAGVRARVAWGAGNLSDALQQLEANRPDVWFQRTVTSPFYGQIFERFMRAELLLALGRHAEAASWYRALVERSPFELPYRPMAHLRLHEIAVRAGDSAAASVHQARFREQLRDAASHVPRAMGEQAMNLLRDSRG
jgi:tetratricopeptide (TPR) repeat protein